MPARPASRSRRAGRQAERRAQPRRHPPDRARRPPRASARAAPARRRNASPRARPPETRSRPARPSRSAALWACQAPHGRRSPRSSSVAVVGHGVRVERVGGADLGPVDLGSSCRPGPSGRPCLAHADRANHPRPVRVHSATPVLDVGHPGRQLVRHDDARRLVRTGVRRVSVYTTVSPMVIRCLSTVFPSERSAWLSAFTSACA